MRSMTGYGRGVVEQGGVRATVDVRAVNHRFLDLKLRGTPVAASLEDAVAVRVRAALERGAVAVSVNLARTGTQGGLRIDTGAAARAHAALVELAARLALPGPDLALVLAQPGVVGTDEPGDDGATSDAVLAALEAALGQLDAMRSGEGAALAADLHGRIDALAATRTHIAVLAAEIPAQIGRRLHERVKKLADDASVDPARLAQEVALAADRADVTEELVRLATHFDHARALIDTAGAVGRRLDFLVQEIGRELNTIGAKSTSAEITTAIVGAKATLEKIREQVQNVE